MSHAGPYGGLPLLIFSRDTARPMPSRLPVHVSADDWHKGNVIHDVEQENFKKLSTDSRRVIVKDSGHYIHFERPEVLNRDVSALVLQIRYGRATNLGNETVTE
jgi:pimeloyl-ACP methyl ester carboxylesterase